MQKKKSGLIVAVIITIVTILLIVASLKYDVNGVAEFNKTPDGLTDMHRNDGEQDASNDTINISENSHKGNQNATATSDTDYSGPKSPDASGDPVNVTFDENLPLPNGDHRGDNNQQPSSSHDNGFIVLNMDVSDTSSGELILVNAGNYYGSSEEYSLVFINEMKTPNYRVGGVDMQLSAIAMTPLNEMMEAFYNSAGLDNVIIRSAFRDSDSQKKIFDEYARDLGRTEALKWALPPGYSEHQTGLSLDFGIYRNGAIEKFEGTGVYTWFAENCDKYGFILRYPQSKTAITATAYEPWHYRYIGQPHASLIKKHNWCFEEFHRFVYGYSRVDPYIDEIDGVEYAFYFTWDTTIRIPEQCSYMISGTNAGGFIVTYATAPHGPD